MLGFLQLAVWAFAAIFEFLVFLVALRSRLYRVFPAFTAFLGWQFIKNIPGAATFFLTSNYYWYVFWIFETVAWLLLFFVIAELARNSLQGYPAVVRLTRNSVLGFGGVFLFTMAFAWLFAAVLPWPRDWVNNWLMLMAGSVHWVQAGMLLGLVTFLQWGRVPTSFLFRCFSGGLLINSIVRFVAAWLRNELGPPAKDWVSLGRALVYVGVVLFWWWALRGRDRHKESASEVRLLSEAESALVIERLSRLNDRLRVS